MIEGVGSLILQNLAASYLEIVDVANQEWLKMTLIRFEYVSGLASRIWPDYVKKCSF
jgi:hypothetical protein